MNGHMLVTFFLISISPFIHIQYEDVTPIESLPSFHPLLIIFQNSIKLRALLVINLFKYIRSDPTVQDRDDHTPTIIHSTKLPVRFCLDPAFQQPSKVPGCILRQLRLSLDLLFISFAGRGVLPRQCQGTLAGEQEDGRCKMRVHEYIDLCRYSNWYNMSVQHLLDDSTFLVVSTS